MNFQIIKLKNLKISMLKQLVELPPMARALAPDMVRRAEFSVVILDEIIGELEALNDSEK